MNITDNNGRIKSGLRADIMRKSMENKNLLNTKGSLYVGTGEKETISLNNNETVDIYKTKAFPLGSPNTVLTTSRFGELSYEKIIPDMLDNTSGNYNIVAANAIDADSATEAQYASSDRSKGTIDTRLTNIESKIEEFIKQTFLPQQVVIPIYHNDTIISGASVTLLTNSFIQGDKAVARLKIKFPDITDASIFDPRSFGDWNGTKDSVPAAYKPTSDIIFYIPTGYVNPQAEEAGEIPNVIGTWCVKLDTQGKFTFAIEGVFRRTKYASIDSSEVTITNGYIRQV